MEKVISNLSLIAAIGQNNELGVGNNLVWRIKEDLQFFKKTTMDSFIIMGRKTYYSMHPEDSNRPLLPGRKYIVLTNQGIEFPEGVLVFNDIEKVKEFVNSINETAYVIGGGTIYEQFLNSVNTMHLTEIKDECPCADVYFPTFDKSLWEEKRSEDMQDGDLTYNHVMYLRKKIDK